MVRPLSAKTAKISLEIFRLYGSRFQSYPALVLLLLVLKARHLSDSAFCTGFSRVGSA